MATEGETVDLDRNGSAAEEAERGTAPVNYRHYHRQQRQVQQQQQQHQYRQPEPGWQQEQLASSLSHGGLASSAAVWAAEVSAREVFSGCLGEGISAAVGGQHLPRPIPASLHHSLAAPASAAINTLEVDACSHSLLSTSPSEYFNFVPPSCSPARFTAGVGVGGVGSWRGVGVLRTGPSSSAAAGRSLLLRSESIPEGGCLDMGNEASGPVAEGGAGGAGRVVETQRTSGGRSATGAAGASNLTVLMERQEQELRQRENRGDSSSGSGHRLASAAADAARGNANSSADVFAKPMARDGPSSQPSVGDRPTPSPPPHRSPTPQAGNHSEEGQEGELGHGSGSSLGPSWAPTVQRGRLHVCSPAGVATFSGGQWPPTSLPTSAVEGRGATSDVLPTAAAAAVAAQQQHNQYKYQYQPQSQSRLPPPQQQQQPLLIPPPKPVLLTMPPVSAVPGFAACAAGRSAPSTLLLNPPPGPAAHQHHYRRVSAPGSNSVVGGVGPASAGGGAATGIAGSGSAVAGPGARVARLHSTGEHSKFVRRCQSNRELGKSPPPPPLSSSPYTAMLYRKEVLEAASQQRLMESRMASLKNLSAASASPRSPTPLDSEEGSTHSSASQQQQQQSRTDGGYERRRTPRLTNETRNRRRAQHNQAVIDDLCEIVADLFLAESKLLHLTGPFDDGDDVVCGGDSSGTGSGSGTAADPPAGEGALDRRHGAVLATVRQFLSDLPPRYALGVDTPSAVLVHMRLMAAARADDTRAAVHIANMDEGDVRSSGGNGGNRRGGSSAVRLVTISCADCDGLLEFITKLLGTGGARVLDADVMLTTDNIVLDRFVVEMKGRLRLDKLQQYIEDYLKKSRKNNEDATPAPSPLEEQRQAVRSAPVLSRLGSFESSSQRSVGSAYGPLYFHSPKHGAESSLRDRLQAEMQSAVPLSRLLGSATPNRVRSNSAAAVFHRHLSAPMPQTTSASIAADNANEDNVPGPDSEGTSPSGQSSGEVQSESGQIPSPPSSLPVSVPSRRRRPLVNRSAVNFGTDDESSGVGDEAGNSSAVGEANTPPTSSAVSGLALALEQQRPVVPLIPFDELMLIETLGSGRVSTIYRAAWQSRQGVLDCQPAMVALKVATVEPDTGGMEHVEELRREADIASMLEHNNICSLVGVASDPECFCLAYEFCEGGSLLSLLSDSSRCYEYLPIALDIANGMAYLHSRDVIHRDLKPSNILMTKNNRAKIADFGMSVTNFGQELTAETGTYRWMAPEVIRHESYSSNADVYSFGIVLWQLITREVPFAILSPIQTAYAVAEGSRPEIPSSTPEPLQRIIRACWDEDSHKRPSFTYIAMALADYAKMAFNPANVGAKTVQIANEMLANVQGNSTVNVDFSTPVTTDRRQKQAPTPNMQNRTTSYQRGSFFPHQGPGSFTGSDVGLQI